MFRLIDEEKAHHSVSLMSRLLGVSRQGYYKHHHRAQSGPSPRESENTELTERIRHHHKQSRGTYGAPRLQADLAELDGMRVGRNRITRLMRREGLVGVHRRTGRKGLTAQDRMASAPPDLVERDFTAHAPNTKWTADITYVPTDQGWLYLAVVMDLFSRRIVGWAMAAHMRAELVCDALGMAVAARRPGQGLIHHSDKGSQGGFNWLSQHLDQGVWKWDDLEAGVLLSPVGRRCAHQDDRPPTRARSSAGSGPTSLKACRPRTPQQRAACQRRSDHGGSVRLVECRLPP